MPSVLPDRPDLHFRRVAGEDRTGVEGLRGDEIVGRLVAALQDDDVRGRHAWTALEDHWLAPQEEPALYRRLYEAAAPAWVEQGYLDHYVVVPAERAVLDAWYSLSFAQQQVHAALALEPLPLPEPERFTVRQGGVEDLEIAMRLAYVIFDYQAEGPTWAGAPAPPEEDVRQSYSEFLGDPGVTYFVAEREGAPLGHLALERETDEAVYLAIAATIPEARGLGVGRTLTETALAWAYENGFRTCTTDWRSANVLSASFWTSRGFEPTAYRLVRSIKLSAR